MGKGKKCWQRHGGKESPLGSGRGRGRGKGWSSSTYHKKEAGGLPGKYLGAALVLKGCVHFCYLTLSKPGSQSQSPHNIKDTGYLGSLDEHLGLRTTKPCQGPEHAVPCGSAGSTGQTPSTEATMPALSKIFLSVLGQDTQEAEGLLHVSREQHSQVQSYMDLAQVGEVRMLCPALAKLCVLALAVSRAVGKGLLLLCSSHGFYYCPGEELAWSRSPALGFANTFCPLGFRCFKRSYQRGKGDVSCRGLLQGSWTSTCVSAVLR